MPESYSTEELEGRFTHAIASGDEKQAEALFRDGATAACAVVASEIGGPLWCGPAVQILWPYIYDGLTWAGEAVATGFNALIPSGLRAVGVCDWQGCADPSGNYNYQLAKAFRDTVDEVVEAGQKLGVTLSKQKVRNELRHRLWKYGDPDRSYGMMWVQEGDRYVPSSERESARPWDWQTIQPVIAPATPPLSGGGPQPYYVQWTPGLGTRSGSPFDLGGYETVKGFSIAVGGEPDGGWPTGCNSAAEWIAQTSGMVMVERYLKPLYTQKAVMLAQVAMDAADVESGRPNPMRVMWYSTPGMARWAKGALAVKAEQDQAASSGKRGSVLPTLLVLGGVSALGYAWYTGWLQRTWRKL